MHRLLNFCRPVLFSVCLVIPTLLSAQDRDVRGHRLVLDDNGSDGVQHVLTLNAPALGQNTVLVIPDIGSDSAQFLLVPSGSSSAAIWMLSGNAGTTPGTDFIGTTDTTALHFYVANGDVNSFILTENGSIQRDVAGDARGVFAVDLQMIRGAATDVASGDYAVIGGGQDNQSSNSNAVVAGGNGNRATGVSSAVGGGISNTASGDGSTVGGGQGNSAEVSLSTIGGGYQNRATGFRSVIAGGRDNWVDAQNATIGGGVGNYVSGSRAVVAGGDTNVVTGSRSTISGGLANRIEGVQSAIAGGSGMTLGANADDCFGFLGGNGNVNPMTVDVSDVAVFGNTDLWLANNDGAAGRLLFYEPNSATGDFPNGANYTAFRAAAQTVDIEYVWPTAVPTTGQVLSVSGVTAGTPRVVTLAWANDATAAGFSGDDNPSSIGEAQSRDSRIRELMDTVQTLQNQIRELQRQMNVMDSVRESRGEGHLEVTE